MNSPVVLYREREAAQGPTVQIDLRNMEGSIGRIKKAPVCVDEELKKEAMSTEELSKLSFPLETPKTSTLMTNDFNPNNEASVVSSSSSTASRESAYFSDMDGPVSKQLLSTPVRLERKQSEQINLKVTARTISRNGRQSQRWFTDPSNQRIYRMVTGCVPIVEGGKILFVSASRKPEWILPKGGWEKDEGIEESAIRECFEEAGVLGILGPRLNEIEYETRKGKKRRLEMEEIKKKAKILRETHACSPTRKPAKPDDGCESSCKADAVAETPVAPLHPSIQLGKEAISTIRNSKPSDETSSVVSDTSQTYSHVRMTLFPLYVSEVKGDWPERGRFRKAVDIDEAIRMCEKRPELQAALKQVKELNLHQLNGENGTIPLDDR